MLSLFAALAASPLTTVQQQHVRCVALLAIVAGEQERRTAAALALPPLARSGARFAQVVGDEAVRTSQLSQDQVRQLILDQVSSIQKQAGPKGDLPISEAEDCIVIMNRVAPPPPPPGAVQCAGALKLVADESRRRAGLSDETKTVMTLAAALENRARAELRAAGKSESESDRDLVLAREAIAKAPQSAPDIEACVELANP